MAHRRRALAGFLVLSSMDSEAFCISRRRAAQRYEGYMKDGGLAPPATMYPRTFRSASTTGAPDDPGAVWQSIAINCETRPTGLTLISCSPAFWMWPEETPTSSP